MVLNMIRKKEGLWGEWHTIIYLYSSQKKKRETYKILMNFIDILKFFSFKNRLNSLLSPKHSYPN